MYSKNCYPKSWTSAFFKIIAGVCTWNSIYIIFLAKVLPYCSHINHCLFALKQPSECNTYADIDAAYKCLKEQYGVKDEQLILYGQSVGSGPTVDLASRLPNLRGVVLHSPILSGMRVLYPVKRTYWFDIYKVI